MKDRDQIKPADNQSVLDRQKLDQASADYSEFASRPEVRTQIQAPPIEGRSRNQKY